ncbi:MAG TPA: NAD-dependent epimerase/dehydratase family protein [archaeon]|nr:NAD-dependent epimerase/dehydratase family protein [archaeon]
MKILVIGATGHIGTCLVPRLVAAGHEVVAMSRGNRKPYSSLPAWEKVETIRIDRKEEDKKGSFGRAVRAVGADVVIDLILFKASSLPQILEALTGRIRQFVFCGTMWVYGPIESAPTYENDFRLPDGEYGIQKAMLESELLSAAHDGRFPATVLHPGHISGPGWAPIGPAGNLNLEVFEKLGLGAGVCLPDLGLATLHHVHADDVAQAFELAVANPRAAIGESFNVVSPRALTLRGFSRAVAGWFSQEARLTYLPWSEWRSTVSEEDAEITWEHIRHCPCGSIEKGRRLLGYNPRYSSLETVREALDWLIRNGKVDLPPLS